MRSNSAAVKMPQSQRLEFPFVRGRTGDLLLQKSLQNSQARGSRRRGKDAMRTALLLTLQQTHGNRAVQRILKGTAPVTPGMVAPMLMSGLSSAPHPLSTVIQLKLEEVTQAQADEITTGIEKVKEEIARQKAVLGEENPGLIALETSLQKITMDDLALAMGRLNIAIRALNKNIESGKVQDVKLAAAASSSVESPKVTMADVKQNPFYSLPIGRKLLQHSDIVHWMERKEPLPENLVVGLIAEALTEETVTKGLIDEQDALVLSDLLIVKPSDDPKYKFTALKQIDVLVVYVGPAGYIPIDLIETKAGLQGNRIEKTKTEAAKKVKTLKLVRAKKYMVHSKGTDITQKFDWERIAGADISASTAGVSLDHNVVLSNPIIKRVLEFLNQFHSAHQEQKQSPKKGQSEATEGKRQ